MSNDKHDVVWIDIDNAEAGDALLQRLADEARPNTVDRIARVIERGIQSGMTSHQMAKLIAGMIFEGEALE